MSDIGDPDHIEHSARVQAEHYRETAAQFRTMADIEPLASARRHFAYSGERDRPFRPKVITDSGDRDHADHGPPGPA